MPVCEPIECDVYLPWEEGHPDFSEPAAYRSARDKIGTVGYRSFILEQDPHLAYVIPESRYPHLNFTKCRNTPTKRLSIRQGIEVSNTTTSAFAFDTTVSLRTTSTAGLKEGT
jgi:hypothetical protein